MAAPLFNFRLRDWEKVEPWTSSSGTKTLSWFAFTDGWYWIACGKEELFRYTPNILAKWSTGELPYCDYQVARLWEDLLQMLPQVLEPVPNELAVVLADEAEGLRWARRHNAWLEGDADLETIEDESINWVGDRFLDAGYLVQCPKIVFWRVEDVIHVRWNNSAREIDGVPIWTATEGSHEMLVKDFLSEVESFHNRFMLAMRDTVNLVAARWNRPDVEIDCKRLVEEQSEREDALSKALTVRHETNWDNARRAIEMMA